MFKGVSAGCETRATRCCLAGKQYRNRAMIADAFGELCDMATGDFKVKINTLARSLHACWCR
jgi:hypothetical protein